MFLFTPVGFLRAPRADSVIFTRTAALGRLEGDAL
jgi:hypothetical protein